MSRRPSSLSLTRKQEDLSKLPAQQRIEKLKEQSEQMERLGTRGTDRRQMDENPLPILDLDMLPEYKPGQRKLYFPHVPWLPTDWPMLARRRTTTSPQTLAGESRFKSYRKAMGRWMKSIAIRTGYTLRRGGLRMFRGLDVRRWSFKGAKERIVSAFKSVVQRPGQWAFNTSKYIVDAKEKGPEALKMYTRRLKNDRQNFASMLEIAKHQHFPEFVWDYRRLAERSLSSPAQWFKDRHRRRKENQVLGDMSGRKDSPLYGILKAAQDAYIDMNKAVADGRIGDLPMYADQRYLKGLEKRARAMSQLRKDSVSADWSFQKWASTPECISIRATDFMAQYTTSFVMGERLYVNMLVKFDSVQAMRTKQKVTNGNVLRESKLEESYVKRRVTEYLILDVRTWKEGRKPKFIAEVFEGQDLTRLDHNVNAESLAKPKEENTMEDKENEKEAVATGGTGASAATG
ncbi:hypothetical protein FRC17_001974 [Serendipita sp. 399]|nr:hypothetical protein FRC17_001974 [Serendipita sp. 399]